MSNDKFNYTYTASSEKDKKLARSLRGKYAQKTNTKMDRLREIDKKINTIPVALSLTVGVVGTLIFGLGLALALEWALYLWGVIVGVVGFIVLIVAYPLYSLIQKHNLKKYEEEVMKLTSEILEE